MIAWWAVVLAAATAALVRFDARAVGPYFSFFELMPGTGITDAILQGEERPIRLAVIRRFGYGFLLGLILAFAFDASLLDAALAGLLVGCLLLWGLLFQGLPTWAAPIRTLIVIYAAVILVYGATASLGYLFVAVVAEGDLLAWAQREGLHLLGATLLAAFGLTLLQLAPRIR